MRNIALKINHILFRWYYKRVPEFYHQWTIFSSAKILIQNYNHDQFVKDGNNKVIKRAIEIENELRTEISNLKMRLLGISQKDIDPINKMFGTNIKGLSEEEINN